MGFDNCSGVLGSRLELSTCHASSCDSVRMGAHGAAQLDSPPASSRSAAAHMRAEHDKRRGGEVGAADDEEQEEGGRGAGRHKGRERGFVQAGRSVNRQKDEEEEEEEEEEGGEQEDSWMADFVSDLGFWLECIDMLDEQQRKAKLLVPAAADLPHAPAAAAGGSSSNTSSSNMCSSLEGPATATAISTSPSSASTGRGRAHVCEAAGPSKPSASAATAASAWGSMGKAVKPEHGAGTDGLAQAAPALGPVGALRDPSRCV